jgi:hypothetical protein
VYYKRWVEQQQQWLMENESKPSIDNLTTNKVTINKAINRDVTTRVDCTLTTAIRSSPGPELTEKVAGEVS